MADRRRNLGRLDEQTAASVRGSQVVGSVWRAIEEILLNAVEACAKSCSISVGKNEIIVSDDGIGIDPEAMRLFIGTEYCSNNSRNTGRKGESLRSIASLCVEMKIETSCWWDAKDLNNRKRKYASDARRLVRSEKVFRDGNVAYFNQSFDHNNSHSAIIPNLHRGTMSGTTINLRGLFYQHAVRRKHIDGGSNTLELNQIETNLRLLALSYPSVAFELKDQSTGKTIASYRTCLERSRSVSEGLTIDSNALLLRLCEIYPNEFNEQCSQMIAYEDDHQTGFNAFGVMCISEDDGDDVSSRNRELEIVCINGRLATDATKLADLIISQTRRCPGIPASSRVRFFIHVTTSSGEVIVKDSKATTTVPKPDLLIAFLQEMLVKNGIGEQAPLCNMEKVASERKLQTLKNNGYQRAVNGQQIMANFETVDNTTDGNISPPSSPFSNAFYIDDFKPTLPAEAIDNSMTDTNAFDDAFLEQESRLDSLKSDINTFTDAIGDDIEEDTTAFSSVWSKQRIKGLEKYIAGLAPDARRTQISLTKQMLATAEVIAQVELKFIIIKAGGILCAVDQHAADERIALEKLENSLCNHGSGDTIIHMTKRSIKAADIIKVTKLLPSKRIILSQKQMSTVKYHWSLLQKWKFTMKEVEENALLLTGVPSVCDRVASVNDFFDFVQELGHITGNDTKPNFVKSTLASNACRYATMFGDPLTHEQCVELISSLAKCEFSFICAHGRPSIVPLYDMNTAATSSSVERNPVKVSKVSVAGKYGPQRVLRC